MLVVGKSADGVSCEPTVEANITKKQGVGAFTNRNVRFGTKLALLLLGKKTHTIR